MILISNIVLEVLDGSTVASTNIYGTDKKTYVNIGSGDVFKLKWNAPTLTNDTVNYYNLIIKRYDPTLNVYYDIFDKNIGVVNEFYVNSSALPVTPEQYLLHIYVVAHSKTNNIITSNIVNPYVSKGSGTYVKVQPASYAVPIMKRAIAFVNNKQAVIKATLTSQVLQSLVDSNGATLTDRDNNTLLVKALGDIAIIKDVAGKEVSILDSAGNDVQLTATKLLTSTDWQLVQSSSIKDPNNTWRTTDIKYEVLVDSAGGLITDAENQPIYVL